MTASVLIVEDEATLRRNIFNYLNRNGYHVDSAAGGVEALDIAERVKPDIVLLDMMLPDIGGMELLTRIRDHHPHTAVIIMTGAGSVQKAVDAMKAGAQEYLTKPLVLNEIKLILDRIIKDQRQASALSYFLDREADKSGTGRIIGDSAAISTIKRRIGQFIDAEKLLTDSEPPSVLITGETGSGKELVARAFHFDGPRREQPFIEVNCATLPSNLLEAELYGFERGAFTDAKKRKIGLVEAANGGTLFLDEIGEMEWGQQAKLLTLLENRRVRRLGSVNSKDVNIRIIAATNQDMEELINKGDFRLDLYYRLRVIHIHVPPLRERGQDILGLAENFLTQQAKRYRNPALRFTDQAKVKLMKYHWPGNVRELRNTIEQAVLLCAKNTELGPEKLLIAQDAVPVQNSGSAQQFAASESLNLRETEIRMLSEALDQADGNVTRAAELLGLSRDKLRYRLRKYGIQSQ